MVWYGMVWYGMVWYGMVWYGMVWYGIMWYCLAFRSVNKLKTPKATKQKKAVKNKNLEPSPKWKSIGFGNDILEKEK
jgi:hypothetical protein